MNDIHSNRVVASLAVPLTGVSVNAGVHSILRLRGQSFRPPMGADCRPVSAKEIEKMNTMYALD